MGSTLSSARHAAAASLIATLIAAAVTASACGSSEPSTNSTPRDTASSTPNGERGDGATPTGDSRALDSLAAVVGCLKQAGLVPSDYTVEDFNRVLRSGIVGTTDFDASSAAAGQCMKEGGIEVQIAPSQQGDNPGPGPGPGRGPGPGSGASSDSNAGGR